jgi:hypothetical protein
LKARFGERDVRSPDGTVWSVGTQLPGEKTVRLRRFGRSEDAGSGWFGDIRGHHGHGGGHHHGGGGGWTGGGLEGLEAVVILLVMVAVLVIFILFILPVLIFLAEVMIVGLVVGVGFVAAAVLRRPFLVVAAERSRNSAGVVGSGSACVAEDDRYGKRPNPARGDSATLNM